MLLFCLLVSFLKNIFIYSFVADWVFVVAALGLLSSCSTGTYRGGFSHCSTWLQEAQASAVVACGLKIVVVPQFTEHRLNSWDAWAVAPQPVASL